MLIQFIVRTGYMTLKMIIKSAVIQTEFTYRGEECSKKYKLTRHNASHIRGR